MQQIFPFTLLMACIRRWPSYSRRLWKTTRIGVVWGFSCSFSLQALWSSPLAVFLDRVAIKRPIADITVGAGFGDSPVLNCQHHGFWITSADSMSLSTSCSDLKKMLCCVWPPHCGHHTSPQYTTVPMLLIYLGVSLAGVNLSKAVEAVCVNFGS